MAQVNTIYYLLVFVVRSYVFKFDMMLIRFAMRLNINFVNNTERNIITLIHLLECIMFAVFFFILLIGYLHLCAKTNVR